MKPPADSLSTTIDAWGLPGTPCDYGCAPEALPQMIRNAEELRTGKRIVAVDQWIWWDLELPDYRREEFKQRLKSEGIQPAYLKANNVISDSSGQFLPGYYARSTALVKLHFDCIFETRNSLYIMVGEGTRNHVPLKVAHSFL